MKKRLFGTAKANNRTGTIDLPIWFPEIEQIDWAQFEYIYSETVDVISIFKSILTANVLKAVQSCIHLNREIAHQDVNEVAASAVIPFYLKIILDGSRPDKVLEIIADSLAMLVENVTWIREEFENQCGPKNFDFLNPGFPRTPSDDSELYNRYSLIWECLWQSYPVFLQSTQSNKSNLYKSHMIELMVSLIICRRVKNPKIEPPLYKETCVEIFNLLNSPKATEKNKTKAIFKLMALAKYDLSLIERLRDWGSDWAHLIWVPRTVAFEIADFKDGNYATADEIALKKTLSRCGLRSHSEYLPVAESAAILKDWHKKIGQYETTVHTIPFLKNILKPPY